MVTGEEEWCCGAPLIMSGDFEGARELAMHNIEKYREIGVKRVITNCPGCDKVVKDLMVLTAEAMGITWDGLDEVYD
ncbi:hypothetical protein EU546_07650 [Candidatus Thorarchaeota archaeon]|nr:MAG: hypothetical protein EU546_07650 [Candidatus Thorarchaeota archaeon]